jgi:hypothetical protein
MSFGENHFFARRMFTLFSTSLFDKIRSFMIIIWQRSRVGWNTSAGYEKVWVMLPSKANNTNSCLNNNAFNSFLRYVFTLLNDLIPYCYFLNAMNT